jgi:tRNA threonylcarbamoyladenosine biosynthesis protein TsaB
MILMIESSGPVGSVAICDTKGNSLGSLFSDQPNAHAELLPGMVEKVMNLAGINTGDLLAVAVNKGPGSYTGLRIGASLAKGLCFGLNIPLIAADGLKVMSLQASKHGIPGDAYVCMVDARRDEVFYAVYDHQFQQMEPLSAKILAPGAWQMLEQKHIVFCGNATDKMKQLVPEHADAPGYDGLPQASEFASEVARQFNAGEFADTAYFEPDYGKAFMAGVTKKFVP